MKKYICKWTSTRANGQVHATYAKVHVQMDKYMLHMQKYTCKWTSTRYIRKSTRCKCKSTCYIFKSTRANGQVHATYAKVHDANGQVHATCAKVHVQMKKYTCKWRSTPPHIYITKTIYHKPLL